MQFRRLSKERFQLWRRLDRSLAIRLISNQNGYATHSKAAVYTGSAIGEKRLLINHLIVVPTTTGSQPAAFRIGLTFQGKSGLVLLDQIRTLDKVRLGAVHPATLQKMLTTL